MPVTATPIFPQAIVNAVVTIAPADTSTVKTLIAAGANGTKVDTIAVTSTDTADRDLNIWVTISATSYLLGTVKCPLSSGNTNAIVTLDMLRSSQLTFLPYDPNGNKYIYLASGSTLSVSATTTVTTAKLITIFASGGNF